MFSILVPEMEGAVRSCSAECTMHRVEGNGVNGEDLVLVTIVGVGLSVTFERKVEPVTKVRLFHTE